MSPVLFPLRLKKKSQSVDIVSQGFAARLIPSLSLNRSSPPVAKTTTSEVQENNTTNSQRLGPRCSNLRRGYTIGKCLQYGRLCLSVSLRSHEFQLSFICMCECMNMFTLCVSSSFLPSLALFLLSTHSPQSHSVLVVSWYSHVSSLLFLSLLSSLSPHFFFFFLSISSSSPLLILCLI